ncbi:MAG: hypothetical protein PHS92_00600 [Candidatus Gracilibacteria bacterium]|nr:hypothetical protein [Candidatus Gracilibacteria bacterium]
MLEKHHNKGNDGNEQINGSRQSSSLGKIGSLRVGRILFGLGILGALSGGAYFAVDKFKARTESIISDISEKRPEFEFDASKKPFWDDNQEFFEKGYKFKKEKHSVMEGRKKGNVSIIHDAGLDFYRVTEGDFLTKTINTGKFKNVPKKDERGKVMRDKRRKPIMKRVPIIKTVKYINFNGIIDKLSQMDRFRYLSRKEYDRNNPNNKISSFNIPAGNIAVGMLLPIPLDSKVRMVSVPKFAYYCNQAINEMKEDKIYGTKVKNLIDDIGEKELITSMIAFARSESTEEYTNFSQQIGKVELHRWEQSYRSFSFTHYHILMKYEGMKARKNLGLTEGQCYHPINSSKLFLAYWIEKSKSTKRNLQSFFPLSDKEKCSKAGKFYNGSYEYVPKLNANYTYVKSIIRGNQKISMR